MRVMPLNSPFKLSEHIPLYLHRNTVRQREWGRQTGREGGMEVQQVYNK